MSLRISALAILVAVLSTSFGVFAQTVPQAINYQGRLREADGTPVTDGLFDLTFTLYDAASEGNTQWTVTQPGVQVRGGLFQVLLSGGTPTLSADVFTGGSQWLGVKINNGTEMTPRQQIASVPYALRAGAVMPGSVGTAALGDGAVTAAKIANQAVTAEKLAGVLTGGWHDAGLNGVTVTRLSADNPTVVLRFNADVTSHIWKGTRIRATENSVIHYFIVSADPGYSGGYTNVTCLSEIDTANPTQAKRLIGTGTISNLAYAPPKTCPKGFPGSSRNWMLMYVDASSSSWEVTPDTWYNLGSNRLTVPIGDWLLEYQGSPSVNSKPNVTNVVWFVTLSTTDNTESDKNWTVRYRTSGANCLSEPMRINSPVHRSHHVSLSTRCTYYLNFSGDSNALTLYTIGNVAPMVIRAICTLL